MKGILAEVHMGVVADALFREMQSPSWIDPWKHLGLVVMHFGDLGLTPTSNLDIDRVRGAGRLFLP